MLVGPRVRDGTKGYHVITPLIRNEGSAILVDRGFVSDDFGELASWRNSQDSGSVLVLGMLRTSQPRNYFTPENKPEKGEWFWVDVDAIAQYAGGEGANVGESAQIGAVGVIVGDSFSVLYSRGLGWDKL